MNTLELLKRALPEARWIRARRNDEETEQTELRDVGKGGLYEALIYLNDDRQVQSYIVFVRSDMPVGISRADFEQYFALATGYSDA